MSDGFIYGIYTIYSDEGLNFYLNAYLNILLINYIYNRLINLFQNVMLLNLTTNNNNRHLQNRKHNISFKSF